jgi:16S rRNA C967 or C1407 C5-methylase (RsmB/RsmF family)
MEKTTHAASLVKLWYDNQDNSSKTSSPTVFAFDRDPARLKTLQNRANNAGCGPALGANSDSSNNKNNIKNKNGKNGKKNKTNDVLTSHGLVVAECIDFLTVDEKSPKYSNVRSMLVDPSCSGSGIVGIDRAIDKTRKSDKKEIEKIESKKERERGL